MHYYKIPLGTVLHYVYLHFNVLFCGKIKTVQEIVSFSEKELSRNSLIHIHSFMNSIHVLHSVKNCRSFFCQSVNVCMTNINTN